MLTAARLEPRETTQRAVADLNYSELPGASAKRSLRRDEGDYRGRGKAALARLPEREQHGACGAAFFPNVHRLALRFRVSLVSQRSEDCS